ncbi:hypothetical protein F5148DRAFT_1167368 [Russula earlei]|uniref:Uncharacterized protein n=1 Tax=Russula earlei TaxID=71964 RepID=A0ACC0UK17_9AGAM|nr:hypothetical protein F5148DRAFT_1167368 [Russula earlei]
MTCQRTRTNHAPRTFPLLVLTVTAMNRPRESLLTLFDPLFSGDSKTPPPCRDVPSPDLGSDKENAAPVGDSTITLTKFFNRIYTRSKTQLPRPLPKGRLIDLGDASTSDDHSDSDEEGQNEHVFVVNHEPVSTSGSREDARRDSTQRRPLADIALGDGRSSPTAAKKTLPAVGCSSSPFGSPSPFKLARPTPAPSSSPLASVINAINGTTSPSPSQSPPSTPSAPRIALIPAEPSTPSPVRRLPRPGAMLSASPDARPRRTSVDLQESLSVHFGESSFDLLKDKISFPENDSLGDVDMDMAAPATMKVIEKGYQGESPVTPSADAKGGSGTEMMDLLEERLRDMNLMDDGYLQDNDGDSGAISTPPAQFNRRNVPTPQAPMRQLIRPKVPGPITSNAPSALLRRRNGRESISTLPVPTAASLPIGKKAKADVARARVAAPFPARKSTGDVMSHVAAHSAPVPPGMALVGVQRPPAPAKKAPPNNGPTLSAFLRTQSQRSKQTAAPAPSSKVTVGGVSGLRPSGLRPPTSRMGTSGIALSNASAGGKAKRVSMTFSSRSGSSAVSSKAVDVKGDGGSAGGRMTRRA